MKFKFKRLTSVLLAAAVGVSVIFAGCSNGGGEESRNYSSNEPSSSESAPRSSKPESYTSKAESSKSESSQAQTSDISVYTPAMWKVTKNDKEMYLFGSIHATDDSAKDLPSYVQNAFDECDYLALEIDMTEINKYLEDFSQAFGLVQKMIYTDGTTIKDHISEETYKAAVKYLTDKGVYISYYDSFKILMWISLIENSIAQDAGIDPKNSMETIMTEKAEDSGKEILEVESVDIQIEVFDKISDKLADYMIKSYTEDGAAEEMRRSLTELYNSWKKGEVVSDNDDTEGLPDDLKDDYRIYNEAMLTNRNVGMADKAEEYMNDGKKVFFMVGAAHMYGESGIVSLLEKRGYTVERVLPDSSGHQVMSKAA